MLILYPIVRLYHRPSIQQREYCISPSNESMFFKRAMGFHGIPQGRLAKFSGEHCRPGELTLSEWLDEADDVTQPMKAMMVSQLKLSEEVGTLRGELSAMKPLVSEVEALRTKVRKLELSRPRANHGKPRNSGRPRYPTHNRSPAQSLDQAECYNYHFKGHGAITAH